jgi:hypothetical protein
MTWFSGQHTYSEIPRVTVIFRSFGGITLIGLGLAIAGGILGSPVSPDDADIGTTLRRVSSCVYAGVWVLLVLAFFGTFSYRWHLRSYRRNVRITRLPPWHLAHCAAIKQLLWGIGIGMPFLGTRIAYGIMAAWSSSNLYGTVVPVNRTLSKMNPVTGDWVMYLVLGLVMEFAAAAMYLFASTVMARRYY